MNKLLYRFPVWFHQLIYQLFGIILVRTEDDDETVPDTYAWWTAERAKKELNLRIE